MSEYPMDPAKLAAIRPDSPEGEDGFNVRLVRTYRVAITRRVWIGHTSMFRTFTVWATSPNPRIPGTVVSVINPTNKENPNG